MTGNDLQSRSWLKSNLITLYIARKTSKLFPMTLPFLLWTGIPNPHIWAGAGQSPPKVAEPCPPHPRCGAWGGYVTLQALVPVSVWPARPPPTAGGLWLIS